MFDRLRMAVWCGAMALGCGVCEGGEDLEGLSRVSVTRVPEWVRGVEWRMPEEVGQGPKSEGRRYLLYERQDHPGLQERFERVVVLLENEAGVQDAGSLTFGFDPDHQELGLHWVVVHRGGERLERLNLSEVRLTQPEEGLLGHVYTGRQAAVLFVPDLRVGDVLEYAHTVRGENPVMAGHYTERITTQGSIPVERQRIRVVWASEKPLHVRQWLVEQSPEVQSAGGVSEYLWDFEGLDAIQVADWLPWGFEPYPYVELSDFASWGEVVDWALPLYLKDADDVPEELRRLIEEWRLAGGSEVEQARLALQFVQDEIRYTGVEIGPDSFRPSDPRETFLRRFGDCKDKVVLLCSILRSLGLEADPALVNSTMRGAVSGRLPSGQAFDHVIAKVTVGGKSVWVDPTLSHQGGAWGERHLPPVGRALVLREGNEDLEEVPRGIDRSGQEVTSRFLFTDYEAPVTFTVRTEFRGGEADWMRAHLARTDAGDLAEEYLNFYARYYPGIGDPGALDVIDDRMSNVLTVIERYRIEDIWELDETSKRWQASFYPESMMDLLTNPETRLRTMPLRIRHPLRRKQEIVVQMPEGDWTMPAMDESVRHRAFGFRYRRSSEKTRVRFHYECETLSDEVAPGEMADYFREVQAMEDLLGDVLYRPDRSVDGVLAQMNWLMVVLVGGNAVFVLLGSFWFLRATRGKAVPDSMLGMEPRLRGLGGWLVLLGIGLCVGPIQRLVLLAGNWEGWFSVHVWQSVAMPQGDHYHPLMGPLLMMEATGNTWFFGVNILLIWLFFGKRRTFPVVFILFVVVNALYLAIDTVLVGFVPIVAAESGESSMRDAVRAGFFAMIWTLYVVKSRRVKATFVN